MAEPVAQVEQAVWVVLAAQVATVALVVPVVMAALAAQLVPVVQEAQEVPVLVVWLCRLVVLVHQVIPAQLVIKVLPELKALPV